MSALSSPLLARIDAAGESLARARSLLCDPSPRNLELSCGVLADVRNTVEAIRAEAERRKSGDRALARAVAVLRSEIGMIAALLERAAAYHANLLETMLDASRSAASENRLPRRPRVLAEA